MFVALINQSNEVFKKELLTSLIIIEPVEMRLKEVKAKAFNPDMIYRSRRSALPKHLRIHYRPNKNLYLDPIQDLWNLFLGTPLLIIYTKYCIY